MKRDGKQLATLPAGDRRRLSDFRNAWRKMSPEQRAEALAFISRHCGGDYKIATLEVERSMVGLLATIRRVFSGKATR